MTKDTIAIIDPAVQRPETESLNRLVLESPFPVMYHLPKLAGTDSLHQTPGRLRGIIVFGSRNSVYDDHDWQKEMNRWLLPQIQAGIPTFGICYGHQLIAHLFGGRVDYHSPERKKLSGLRTVSLENNRLWGASCQGTLAVSHEEVVVECPPEFEIVGRSPEVAVEALTHRHLPIWTFQAHPEATATFLKRRQVESAGPQSLEFGYRILSSFLKYVANR